MITIRFSNLYIKMPPGFERLVLAGLKLVNLEDLYPAFLEADTAIVGGRSLPSVFRGQVHDIAAGYQWPYLADYQALDSSERGVLPQPHR
jgi:hypothetical protein